MTTRKYYNTRNRPVYVYGNLNFRTNNALVQTFKLNPLNELTNLTRSGTLTVAGTTTTAATNVTVNTSNAVRYADYTFAATNFTLFNGTNTFTAIGKDSLGNRDTNVVTANLLATNKCVYDLNGNLRTNGNLVLDYDDENELIRVTLTNGWKNEFVYDGKLRRRIERDYAWIGGSWTQTNEIRFIYDGNVVVQERNSNNVPVVSYTRGNDLSGALQGAGGIGGLLARSDHSQPPTPYYSVHSYYHADGNGNVTMLINASQAAVAKYLYDPFGNMLSMSGPLAAANKYRFSSKEWNDNAGLYYYGRRFYDPNLQRWPNRDPIDEEAGYNLYGYVGNDPISRIDLLGEDFIAVGTKIAAGFLPGHHMSLEYYTEPSKSTQEGFSFNSPSDVSSAIVRDYYQLEPVYGTFGHWKNNPTPGRNPPNQIFVPELISFVDYAAGASQATKRTVIYADGPCGAAADAWTKIADAAANYEYAEHDLNEPALQHWPNSVYQLLGNNSNTFIRYLARAIGKDGSLPSTLYAPGNVFPQPVPNPGYTPVRQ